MHAGAPFVMAAVCIATSVKISGETYRYHSSVDVDRRGCAKCGAPLFIVVDADDGLQGNLQWNRGKLSAPHVSIGSKLSYSVI